MRKQLIIKIPNTASTEEINAVAKFINNSYSTGYPMYIFPNWDYEIVELSEPMMIVRDCDYESAINKLKENNEKIKNLNGNVAQDH